MDSNLEKKKNHHESPHIIVRKSLYLILDNSIILKRESVTEEDSYYRKIHYEIHRIGRNIKIKMKNPKYRNMKLEETANRKFIILVPLKSVENLAHVVYFDEWGKRMDKNDLAKLEKAYVQLVMAKQNNKM